MFGKRTKAKNGSTNSLNSISETDEIHIQGTTLRIETEVMRSGFKGSQFGALESRLQITINNDGEKATNNLSVEATAPAGSELIDPGALFGNGRRFVRMPPLAPNKRIRYKLGIRISDHFEAGNLVIKLSTVLIGSAQESAILEIPLRATASN
jgi:hypothetical protein